METENFVTVVSVGSEVQPQPDLNGIGYVTVLTIGDGENNKDTTEEVLVYRLPGERLGFGLKFEGGTKASEFVKRLFIQSCAPDSPASRVISSWGKLTEGDEVLEIDGVLVNSMTRIDCVRCLKDSNVVIKLLVRHFKQPVQKARSIEDIPLVISAEKKRIPPPPPPVPPRKIPRKLYKNIHHENNKENVQEVNNNPVPTSRNLDSNKVKKFQSPRSSGRLSYSPDIPRRDRRFSDGSLGPPDAEVYINLLSQESCQSLSESDDTASTISTVIDRFGSFPTTTTSSFAGSLPSTPTSIQKQLDLTNLLIFEDDDVIPTKITTNGILNSVEIEKDGVPLQPPSCFQDAPLSYGNEDMRTETKTKTVQKPPVPPRSRDLQNSQSEKEKEFQHDENMNNLPRLVDFLPKSSTKENIEVIKLFLENERMYNEDDFSDIEVYETDMDVYSSKWSISPQLTTIGEVEEEGSEPSYKQTNSTPIVIVENADSTKIGPEEKQENAEENPKDIDGNMDTPPSDSRQPPDGHEFPDYVEFQQQKTMASFPKPTNKVYKSIENINLTECSLNFAKSNNNGDIIFSTDDIKFTSNEPAKLHTRSQSLIDMSTFSKEKNDKFSMMIEHRRKGLSKLKGLVIPENVNEEVAPSVNLPEIKSVTNVIPVKQDDFRVPEVNQVSEFTKPSLTSPPWACQTSTFPKYSPAFKRKSLQVYTTKEKSKPSKLEVDESLSDPPKSLESITSPTRSDYSFDYVSSAKKDALKKESSKDDESDNDSAVSSSQSSYRCSPPASPTCNDYDKSEDFNNRLLKPSSVEAINRKNILASAKCRSGRDLKVGSPVIQRKHDEEVESELQCISEVDGKKEEEVIKLVISNVPVMNGNSEPKIESASVNVVIEKPALPKTAPRQLVRPTPRPQEKPKENVKVDYTRSSSILKKPQPLSVNALKKNFENLTSTAPVKTNVIKTNNARQVKSEIEKTENKITQQKIEENEVRKNVAKEVKKEKESPKKPTPIDVEGKFKTVILKLDEGVNLGVSLNGENKDITIQRIRYGSAAYQDGRLKRGDKIISINGRNTKGLTYENAQEILKEPLNEFTIVIEERDIAPAPSPSRRLSSALKSPDLKSPPVETSQKSATNIITLNKDGGAGLGFSIEGGKDSPLGDVPLLVKKIFQGGAAEKGGDLHVGDEIIAINEKSFKTCSRIEAWNLMKKLPDGKVTIHIHR
ncbi:unnamed protein product [Brassicogethes aeneus]|uniref:PDZ domain-containing protein n=1 Tax=Brassicogethes aeneus TaxID=1431903 RepID=A0A9P0BFV1_BRAAE|nr:unnamed protein product [Brassicogethes aeneus]